MKDEQTLLEMFHNGYAVELISDKINVSTVSIHKYLRRNNLSRPRYAVKFRKPASIPVKDKIEGTSMFSDCLRLLSRTLPE